MRKNSRMSGYSALAAKNCCISGVWVLGFSAFMRLSGAGVLPARSCRRLAQAGGNVLLQVRKADHVEMIRVFDVEQRIPIAVQHPVPQLRNGQLVRVAWRTAAGMALDMRAGQLQRVQELQRRRGRHIKVVREREADVLFRPLRANGRLHFPAAFFTCWRRLAKYAASMRPAGLDATPSSRY